MNSFEMTDKERREALRSVNVDLYDLMQVPWPDRTRENWLRLSELHSQASSICEAQYYNPPEREEFS